jgi:hypothetical protein
MAVHVRTRMRTCVFCACVECFYAVKKMKTRFLKSVCTHSVRAYEQVGVLAQHGRIGVGASQELDNAVLCLGHVEQCVHLCLACECECVHALFGAAYT